MLEDVIYQAIAEHLPCQFWMLVVMGVTLRR